VADADARSDQLTVRQATADGSAAGCTPVRTRTALTVILPCYNEAERLPGTLKALLAHLSRVPDEVELLVVDDGSTDATAEVANAVAAVDARVRVLSCHPNHGKGFAVRTGMLAAEGELIVFTDADGSYRPSELDRIIGALGVVPVAIGARATGTSGPVARRVASRVFNLAIRGSLGLPFGDTQSGLKGFRRAAAREIFTRAQLDGFAFDVEALWLAHRLGLEVAEVRVQAMERQGSKVRMLDDALRMLGEVWAVRRATARGAYGDVCQTPTRSPEAAASVADPRPTAAARITSGAPPALLGNQEPSAPIGLLDSEASGSAGRGPRPDRRLALRLLFDGWAANT
jgi:dolichyl-phosphate beta-glucosyltransferase